MSKKGENIYKRKDGRWEGRYIRHHDVNGKAKYGYVYGRSYYEVKQKLIELKSQIIKCPNCIRTDSLSYGDVLDGWLTSSKLNTKESTYARYSHLIKAHIKPKLGEYQISRITTQHIEEFAKELLVEGRLDNSGGLSPKTVTDVLTIVKSSFEYAKFMNMPVVCNLSRIQLRKKKRKCGCFLFWSNDNLLLN